MSSVFPKEVQNFIFENYKGLYQAELQKLIYDKFGLTFTLRQIQGFKMRHHLDSGLKNQTSKGGASPMKGKKQSEEAKAKCRASHIGRIPWNKKPELYEKENKQGYIMMKVNGKFIEKHRYIWQQHNGEIPAGHIVIFADGNNRNFDLDNLVLISRRTSLAMSKNKLFTNDAEATKTGVLIGKLIEKTWEKKGEQNENHD